MHLSPFFSQINSVILFWAWSAYLTLHAWSRIHFVMQITCTFRKTYFSVLSSVIQWQTPLASWLSYTTEICWNSFALMLLRTRELFTSNLVTDFISSGEESNLAQDGSSQPKAGTCRSDELTAGGACLDLLVVKRVSMVNRLGLDFWFLHA